MSDDDNNVLPANDPATRAVDELFNSFITDETPGAIVIVLRDSEIQYESAYGLANLEENVLLSADHMMHIASMGKQMTGLAVMMLSEDGLLKYDDPVGRHIPELEHFGEDFTIRTLLNHTSGLADYDDGITDALFELSDEPTNDDLVTVLSQMDGPTNEPGTEFLYSNPGYDLLAVVIERASGMTYPEFMQSHIFDKLGMTHTFSLPNPQRRNGPMVAISYTLEDEAPVAYPFDSLDNLVGSGSIYTTVGDMALYDEALYGDELVAQSTLQDAFQPAQLKNGSSEPYGFGWELEEWNGESYIAHSGAWLGFQSDYVRFPERHFSVIVMLNRDYDIPDSDERIALQVAEFYLK
ncbi:MAG: beta-lactamase family protein [Anaerolineales bacterium]|nr:beta-lactamase family protein [Anaerolineales bacterium]